MTKQFLQQIAFMCLMLMLGIMNWIAASFASKTWIFFLDVVAAVICFFMACVAYRKARKTAEFIDAYKASISRELILHYELIKYLIYGKESESEGKGEEQAENEVQSGTDRENESEDYCASPI